VTGGTRPAHHPATLLRIEHAIAARILLAGRIAGAFSVLAFVYLLLVHGIPRSVDRAPWEPTAQMAALAAVTAAYLLSWRWVGAGGWALTVAGIALGVLASLAYEPRVALLAALAFVVPGALLLLHWQRGMPWYLVVGSGAAVAFLLATGSVAAQRTYDHYFGPTHPESQLEEFDTSRIEWVWTGALRTDGATVKARLAHAGAAEISIHPADDPGSARTFAGRALYEDDPRLVTFDVTGLDPGVAYEYSVVLDRRPVPTHTGRFRTMPRGPASFTIAFGSCMRTASNGQVFDRIREADPLFFLIPGDFNYANLASTDPVEYAGIYGENLGAPAQQALFLQTPVVYVWDDHDYGGNDSDAHSRSRDAVREAYSAYVPHYPLVADADGPIYQAFTVGRVRFLVTDTRSERDPGSAPPTMLGASQKQWLKDQMLAARDTHALTVWVSAVPWIAEAAAGADNWSGYAEERQEIADFIAANGITSLAMLSGDAHMLAIDDGTHSNFASEGGMGFPVFHAAALDRRGNLKGGPYSEGAIPGGGHFGLMTVTDTGDQITVEWSGRDYTGVELIRYRFTRPA
jgi:hypothetical protein